MKLDVSDCAFCSIVRGEVDSATIFEDDATLAFLNLRQSNEGHVLVVPKRHFEQIYDLDEEIASSLAKTVRRVARAVRRVYEPEGLSIWQSNGAAARFRKCRTFIGTFFRATRTMAFSWCIPRALPAERGADRCSF